MVPGMGWMMMSGVRGSVAGLPNWAVRAGPNSNVWIRAGLPWAMLACRAATPLAVSAAWVAGFIQINATSSSVTMAVMMIVVVASTPWWRSSVTIDPMAVSTNWMAPFNCGVKRGLAEVLPGSYP